MITGFALAMATLGGYLWICPKRPAIWAPWLLLAPVIWVGPVKCCWLTIWLIGKWEVAAPTDPPAMLPAMCTLLVIAAPLGTWELQENREPAPAESR